MRILLDECLPRPLTKQIPNHEVKTVPEMGWAGISNGRLLTLMQREFDVLITVDRNLVFQQRVADLKVAVIVLHAKSNRLVDLRPLAPEVTRILQSVRKGDIVHVGE